MVMPTPVGRDKPTLVAGVEVGQVVMPAPGSQTEAISPVELPTATMITEEEGSAKFYMLPFINEFYFPFYDLTQQALIF